MKKLIIVMLIATLLTSFSTKHFAPLMQKKDCGYLYQSQAVVQMYLWMEWQSELFQEESYSTYQNEFGLWCWEVNYRILPPINP